MERYRIADDVGIDYVTMSVVDWLPVFVSEQTCRVLAESLNFCHAHKGLRINAYVIMTTHFHAIVFLERFDPEALQATLVSFRKFTGRQLSELCCSHMPACFAQGSLRRRVAIGTGGSGSRPSTLRGLKATCFTCRR